MQSTLKTKLPLQLDADAAEFCHKEGLDEYLQVAGNLIHEHFEMAKGAVVRKEEDPEIADHWLSISISALGDVEAILDAYDDYTDAWLVSSPPEIAKKIRLSLGVA